MENASKALIIAGAILISILLISVGIIVMNSINKPLDQAQGQADSQAVEMFNARFTGYLGGGQSLQSMKTLINTVKSTTDRTVTLDTSGITSVTHTDMKKGNTFTAEVTDWDAGYISKIKITKE